MNSLLDAFPSAATPAALVSWAVHAAFGNAACLVRQGPVSWRYRNAGVDFTVASVALGRTLLVHSQIVGDRNVVIRKIPIMLETADRAGLERFLEKVDIGDIVHGIIKEIIARSGRMKELSVEEEALVCTMGRIRARIESPYDLLCIAIHALFVNDDRRLIWAGRPDRLCSSPFLPHDWHPVNGAVYRFGYGTETTTEMIMTCMPFPAADRLVVVVESCQESRISPDNPFSIFHPIFFHLFKTFFHSKLKLLIILFFSFLQEPNELCLAASKAHFTLSIRRFVTADLQLANTLGLIATVHNAIWQMRWRPAPASATLYMAPWLLLHSLSFLSYRDLSHLRSVSPSLNSIALHPFLWKRLYLREGWTPPINPVVDWHSAFRSRRA